MVIKIERSEFHQTLPEPDVRSQQKKGLVLILNISVLNLPPVVVRLCYIMNTGLTTRVYGYYKHIKNGEY